MTSSSDSQYRPRHCNTFNHSSVAGVEAIPRGFLETLGKRCTEWLDWRNGLAPCPSWHKSNKRQPCTRNSGRA